MRVRFRPRDLTVTIRGRINFLEVSPTVLAYWRIGVYVLQA